MQPCPSCREGWENGYQNFFPSLEGGWAIIYRDLQREEFHQHRKWCWRKSIIHTNIPVLVAGGYTESLKELGIALGSTSSLTFL